jgi:hypothetical protein
MRSVFLTSYFILFFTISSFAQGAFITVGSGGGFSGIANVYKISSDGKVWKGKGTASIQYTECSKIKKKKAQLFIERVSQEVKALGELKHPGNMYYFLSVSENGNEKRITWGDPQLPVGESTKKIYQEVIDAISTLKYKPVK